jgi:steroid 5-alpha reductase family enzyme
MAYTLNSKGISLLLVTFIYAAAFGTGAAILHLMPVALAFTHPLWTLFAATFAATAIVFISSLVCKNASVYDPYWSVQPLLLTAAFYWRGTAFHPVQLLTLVPLTLWSLRLTCNWITGFENLGWEDWRYRDLKRRVRCPQVSIFLGVMLMPTCLVFLGCIPLWRLLQTATPGVLFPAAGGFFILLGTALEHCADTRMRSYKRNPNRGPYIDEGLWRYSRHPNYLGEILVWVGVFISGLENFSWLNGAGLALIMLLFTTISIPMMEKYLLEKYPAYARYRDTVSPLIPWKRKTP